MDRHSGQIIAVVLLLLSSCAASPPARDIVFVSQDGASGPLQLWRMAADGSSPRPLTTETELLGPATNFPDWSPDGKRVAFSSGDRNGWSIYVVNADGTKVTRLGPAGLKFAYWPAWSPDGKRILFNAGPTRLDQDLFMMNPDGSDLTKIKSDEWSDNCARWSPDGTRILVNSSLNGTVRLTIMNLKDGSQEEVLPPGFDGACGDWSPDGKAIAFSSPLDHDFPSGSDPDAVWPTVHAIYVVELATGDIRQVTHLEGLSDRPRWSRDGQWLVFNSTESVGSLEWPDSRITTGTEVYVIGADGSDLRRLTTNNVFDAHPAW